MEDISIKDFLRDKSNITQRNHARCECGGWEQWFDIEFYTAEYGQMDYATFCYDCGHLWALDPAGWYDLGKIKLDESPPVSPFVFPNQFMFEAV